MSWLAFAPAVVVLAVLFFVPGWAILRAAGVRGLLALGGAPAASAAYLGLAGLVLDRAGIAWGWVPLIAGLVPLVALAAACGLWVRRATAASGLEPGGVWTRRYVMGRRRSLVLAAALVLSAVTFLVPYLVGLGGPDAVVQQWDAVFHANGVQLIRDSGNASVLGAMAGQYGAAAPGVYYPVVWHAAAALAPGSVALVMNASVVVLATAVWLLGLAALGRVVGERAWSLAVWTPVLGAAFGHFPSRILVELSQLPLGTAIAVLPGAAALWIAASRIVEGELGLVSGARRVVGFLVVATVAAGVALAHGAGLFSFLLVVLPAAVLHVVRGVRWWWATGRRRPAILVSLGFGLVLLAGLVLALSSSTLRAVASYTYDTRDFALATVYRTLFDLPTAPVAPGLWPLAILTMVGAVVVARRAELARERWLLWSAGVVLLVAAASAGGLGPLRVLAGPWYSQTARITAVWPVVAAPLAALGLLAVARWLLGRVPALGRAGTRLGQRFVPATEHRPRLAGVAALVVVLAFALTLGWYAPQKAERGGRYTLPEPIQWGTMLSEQELALMKRLPQTTPADAVILGDPANGAAFAYSMAQRRVVFPQLDPSNQSEAQRSLRFGFDLLGSEPSVCAAVRELGVTHFYLDTTGPLDGAKTSADWTGVTSRVTPELEQYLEVVDQTPDGRATLYLVDPPC